MPDSISDTFMLWLSNQDTVEGTDFKLKISGGLTLPAGGKKKKKYEFTFKLTKILRKAHKYVSRV